MIDLISFNKSLKATWVKKYLDTTNNGKWKIFWDLDLQNCGLENILSCNLNVTDILETVKVTDPFLKEILEIWAEVNYEHHIASEVQFQEQNLWFNSLIRIGNKPVLLKDWPAKGITKVKQLQKLDSSNYLSLNEFRSKYSLNARPLSFCGMISAVKLLGQSQTTAAGGTTKFEPFSTKLLNTKKVSSLVYKKLVKRKGSTLINSQKKWLEDCDYPDNESLNWTSAYLLTSQCTKCAKLIEFQFKFLHRRLSTNHFLFKIGLKENGYCSLRQSTPETLIHLFWSCRISASFWSSVTKWLQNVNLIPKTYILVCPITLDLRPETSKSFQLINYCFLLARYSIWLAKSKETSPNLSLFLRLVKLRYEIESKGGDIKKWKPLAGCI